MEKTSFTLYRLFIVDETMISLGKREVCIALAFKRKRHVLHCLRMGRALVLQCHLHYYVTGRSSAWNQSMQVTSLVGCKLTSSPNGSSTLLITSSLLRKILSLWCYMTIILIPVTWTLWTWHMKSLCQLSVCHNTVNTKFSHWTDHSWPKNYPSLVVALLSRFIICKDSFESFRYSWRARYLNQESD
jgi:hypothetical protein